jgi:hypothetical protein
LLVQPTVASVAATRTIVNEVRVIVRELLVFTIDLVVGEAIISGSRERVALEISNGLANWQNAGWELSALFSAHCRECNQLSLRSSEQSRYEQ